MVSLAANIFSILTSRELTREHRRANLSQSGLMDVFINVVLARPT